MKKKRITLIFCALVCFLSGSAAHAWGRHDLITQIALDSPDLGYLNSVRVKPESIEKAAPDLLARVIPDVESWCVRFHHEHDTRYAWSIPKPYPGATPREALLWDLEDNMNTPLRIPANERGRALSAGEILVDHVDEPDGLMDGKLDRAPYLSRLRASMSYFLGNDVYTHAFRHYYVPSSLLPPILQPRGIAPYRAALYAKLASGAFRTGHPYWGYRFLAWSIHYVQDVTQPWHTIFLPDFSFLSFSKKWMQKEVESLHYLTEAFSDSWMERALKHVNDAPFRSLASANVTPVAQSSTTDPWIVAEITEKLATSAHAQASRIADLAKSLFQPLVDQLNDHLKPAVPIIALGGLKMPSHMLDFWGNGAGATSFLSPIWDKSFDEAKLRDQFAAKVVAQLDDAVSGSREVIQQILGSLPAPGRAIL